MIDGEGLRFLDECKLGIDEMQWWKEGTAEEGRRLRLQQTERPGLLCRLKNLGTKGLAWQCNQDGTGSGNLRVKVDDYGSEIAPNPDPAWLLAIDRDGHLIEFDGVPLGSGVGYPTPTFLEDVTGTSIAVPDDATWYTLVMRRDVTPYERGTLQVTAGSAAVVGTGTEFTRFNGYTTDGYDRGTRILILLADSAGGNEGTYEVDTITDDVNLTLRANIGGANESGIRFQVAGDFANTVPGDPAIHHRTRAVFELVARTREPANDDLIIADVMLNTGTSNDVQIIDRRDANVWSPRFSRNQLGKLQVTPQLAYATVFPYTGVALSRPDAYTPGVPGATWVRVAPAEIGGLPGLLGVVELAGVAVRTITLAGETWSTSGNVDVAGTAQQPAIVQVPAATGYTHRALYVKGGILYRRSTADNGVVWGAETAIWDPTAVDPADYVEYPFPLLTLKHRLIVAAGYWDDSADGGAGQMQVRWIYSDDYGDTWETNANAGTEWIANITAPATYRDCSKPSLWQSGNGLIACAFVEDGDLVRMLTSHSDNGLIDNPEAVAVQRKGTAVTSAAATYDPAIFCDAQGNVLTFAAEHVAGLPRLEVIASRWGASSVVDERVVAVIQDGGGVAADPVSCAVAQIAGGSTLYLFFSDTADANPPIVCMKMDLSYGPSEWRAWE